MHYTYSYKTTSLIRSSSPFIFNFYCGFTMKNTFYITNILILLNYRGAKFSYIPILCHNFRGKYSRQDTIQLYTTYLHTYYSFYIGANIKIVCGCGIANIAILPFSCINAFIIHHDLNLGNCHFGIAFSFLPT
jgi:hypothetical protein